MTSSLDGIAEPDALALLRGIRDANYHRGGIRCLRLLQTDPALLRALVDEVASLRAVQRPSLATEPGHVTAWTRPRGRVEQFSLLGRSERFDDFRYDHDMSCFGKRFRRPEHYPRLAAFAASLPPLVNFRVNILAPAASLAPHEEHSVVRSREGNVGVRARFHLPLVTSSAATLLLDGEVHHLVEGTVYLVNHGCVHAAENRGDADRVHLVWDMLLTAHAVGIMFGTGPAPAGLTRLATRSVEPVAWRPTPRWEAITQWVRESDARAVGFMEIQ